MKATYKFVIAALAATLALASCTKETAEPGIADSATKGVRTIAVSFGNSTKSSLWDGPTPLTPTFEVDDEICVAQVDGEAESQTCKVKQGEGGILVIETNLEGKLDAVYPATAATLDGNKITGVNVPTLQHGTFAEANICQATIPAGSSNAEFENKVSILKFYVDKSIEVLGLEIREGEESVVQVQAKDDYIENKAASSLVPPLYTSTDDPDGRISYVAVSPGVYENFTVSSHTTTQDAYENMVVVKEFGDVTFAAGTIYNVFIPYYINVKVSEEPEKYQRWAYCNVGAFLPEEPGLYFAWGEVKGHKADFSIDIEEDEETGFIPNAFSKDFEEFVFDPMRYNSETLSGSECFATCNAPYRNVDATAQNYSKYNDTDKQMVLLPMDDAASVNWKGKWRMPTIEEFTTLINSTGTQAIDKVDNNLKIKNSNLVLPAAGMGTSTHLALYSKIVEEKYNVGRYWAKNLNNNESDEGRMLNFYLGVRIDCPESCIREQGLSIRPIYDETLSDGGDPVGLTITAYPNGGTF